MRILFVIGQLGLGGQEKRLVDLLLGSDPKRIQSRVVVFHHGGEREHRLRQAGIQVALAGSGTSRLSRIRGLWRECQRFRPEIIQAFDCSAGLYCSLVGRIAGVPVVMSSFNTNYLPITLRCLQSMLWPLMDKVVCNSEDGRRYLEKHCNHPADRLTVIPNGLDCSHMEMEFQSKSSLRAELGIGPDHSLVGMVGKLNSDKTPMVFAHAARIVHEAHPSSRFCIVGSGPHEAEVRQFLRTTGLSEVFFLIPQRPDAPWLAREFDIGVLCSHAEGLPNVLLEYMYWEKPCVTTDVGDCGRVIRHGETGLVVKPGDPVAFAAALLDLLRDPGKAEAMGKAGRARLLSSYTSERYVRDFTGLCEAVLKTHPEYSAA